MSDWKLVPIEPTPQMCAKGLCVTEAEHDPAGVYKAMLAAAPTSEVEPVGYVYIRGNLMPVACLTDNGLESLKDGQPLYAHSATSHELVEAAREVLKAYEDGEETNLYNKMTDIRAALDKVKS